MLQNVNLISCFNSLVKVDWLKKKKYNLGAFLFNFNSFDLNLFFVNLDKIYNIYIEFHLVYFVSLLGYLYFFYNLYNYINSIKIYFNMFSNGFINKANLKLHFLVIKAHGYTFLKQKRLYKLVILVFILFKIKIIIKLIFFKNISSFFCLCFLYGQSVFIKHVVNCYYAVLSSLRHNNINYTMSTIIASYYKYKISSFFIILFVLLDFILFCSLFISIK